MVTSCEAPYIYIQRQLYGNFSEHYTLMGLFFSPQYTVYVYKEYTRFHGNQNFFTLQLERGAEWRDIKKCAFCVEKMLLIRPQRRSPFCLEMCAAFVRILRSDDDENKNTILNLFPNILFIYKKNEEQFPLANEKILLFCFSILFIVHFLLSY